MAPIPSHCEKDKVLDLSGWSIIIILLMVVIILYNNHPQRNGPRNCSLCKLFNQSLQERTLPHDWKLANIVPVHKNGETEYTENYRCIFVNKRCFSINTLGYLLHLIHEWHSSREILCNKWDKIDHRRFLQKLQVADSGIGNKLLNWFHSYLTDRRQQIAVLGVTSDPLLVGSGVPQGSTLDQPYFFSMWMIFVNPWSQVKFLCSLMILRYTQW